MSEERRTGVEDGDVPENELGWVARMMIDSLRKRGWLLAVERRAALVTELEEQATTLRHNMAGLEQDIILREAEIREKTLELAGVQESSQRDKFRLQERIDHLTRELDVRAHTLASAMTSQENLERKALATEVTLTQLEKELVEHAATALALRTTVAGREQQLGRANRELDEAKKSITKARDEKAESQRQLEELATQLAGLLSARETRITQLEEALVEALAARASEKPPPDADERMAGLRAELEERDALVGELERAVAVQRIAIAKRDAALATLGAPPASVRSESLNREA